MLKATHAGREPLAAGGGGGLEAGPGKLTCPDDQRLIGISRRGQGGLCTDAGAAALGASGALSRVTSEAGVTTDWARGFTKYQCAEGQFMTGYSVRGDRVSAVLCSPARIALAGPGRTLWDDRGDSRPSSGEGGDYATGFHKAQCRADEYAAGSPSPRRSAGRAHRTP
ncbi:Glycoside hydrolase family 5 domain-containing protein OS=Streptomyces microflavus OX=1919 GN=Smic_57830 PE=3 SV=1 [Streptomyces microflavus]